MGKIVSSAQISDVAEKLRTAGKRLVLAGGCFDILHIAHIEFLESARQQGDILILLLESDEAIKKLKGDQRPINIQANRAKVLSSVEFVDFVVNLEKSFSGMEYEKLTLAIKPDVIAVSEGDPNLENKQSQAKKVGGVVKTVLKHLPEHSTTKILEYF